MIALVCVAQEGRHMVDVMEPTDIQFVDAPSRGGASSPAHAIEWVVTERSLAALYPILTTTPLDPLSLIHRSRRADSTKSKYVRVLRPYVDAGGNLLDVQALSAYAETLSSSRRSHLRSAVSLWAEAMIAHIKSTVTEATKTRADVLLMRLDALPRAIAVETHKGHKAHTWLSPKQVRALMQTCGDDVVGQRDRVVLGLMVGAGLRRSELAGLHWEQVKCQPVGESARTVLDVHGKGAKDRVVPISDRLAEDLDQWRAITGPTGCVARSLGMAQEIGESLSDVAIFQIVRKHGVLIGVPELAAHDLRRTYAQIGYEAGVSIAQISTLLGHSSIETTQRYLNLELDLETTVSDFVPI